MTDPKAAAILAAYRDYLLSDGKSPTTVDVAAFLDWLESKDAAFAGTMKRFHITSYRNHLVDQQFEINTINKKVNNLHSFNCYLVRQELMQELVVFPRKDKVKRATGSEQDHLFY